MATRASDGSGTILTVGAPTPLTLSASALASGGTTLYTGTIGAGFAAYVGQYFAVAGFTSGVNNGYYLCSAATATNITLVNPAGILETHAATALANPVIGEIQSVKQSGAKWDTEDATNFSSTAKEFVATILDWGTFDISAKRVSTDAGQLLLVAAFNTGAATPFTLTLPFEAPETVVHDRYTFNAVVTELDTSFEYNKLTPLTCKLKVVGQPTYTQGS